MDLFSGAGRKWINVNVDTGSKFSLDAGGINGDNAEMTLRKT
jgi:hypothetical protein